MIDLDSEQVVSFKQAAELVPWPDGKKPSHETIRRWASRGVRGHKLESVLIGGRRVTTLEAIQQASGHGDFCGSHASTIPSLWECLRP